MLNGSSPYIHPDFYNPHPSPIDAKSSPLALLAKTCSSIGKDSPPTKPILQTLEKKESEKSEKALHGDKLLTSAESKDVKLQRDKPGFRTFNLKDASFSKSSPPSSSSESTKKDKESQSLPRSPPSSKASDSSGSPQHSSSPTHPKASSYHGPLSSSYSSGLKSVGNSLYSDLAASSGLGYSGLAMLGGHAINPELALAYHQSQLLAQSGIYGLPGSTAQQAALKASAAAAAAASMNPYVSYTRVRTPSGGTALVPVCKDPYCTNCQLTVQTSHTSTTCKTPGCSQCAHEKALLGLSTGAAGYGIPGNPLSLYPHLSSVPTSATGLSSLSSLHSFYPHSALSAHQGLPYVCNWVAGHDYCGKRFNSSEELMQHLRSHTSSIESGFPVGYGLGLPSGISAHLGGAAPISPNSLRRAYPTSVSPGLLSSSRFHPYKSPLGTATAPPSASHLSPLSPYYPYSLYAQRMGAVP